MRRMHPFFTFHIHTHTYRQIHVFHVYPSPLPPLLFSSLPDPTSGPPRRSCFLLPDWAYIAHTHTHIHIYIYTHTHTHTRTHSLAPSLCGHMNCQSIQQQLSTDLTASLLWGQGLEMSVCVCVCVCVCTVNDWTMSSTEST